MLALALTWNGDIVWFAVSRALNIAAASGAAAAVVAAITALGLTVVSRARWRGLTLLEAGLLAFGCGAALLSCVVLAAGLAGLTGKGVLWLITALLIACGVIGVAAVAWHGQLPSARVIPPEGAYGACEAALLAAVILAVLLMSCAAIAPPLLYDVTEYHLGALADYMAPAGGRFTPMPHNFYARFPFPVEALYFLGCLLETPRDFAPKLINMAFVAGCAALMGAWLRRDGVARVWRMLAILLFLAHPIVLEISIDAYIDAASAFLLLASLFAMTLVENTDKHGQARTSTDKRAGLPGLVPVAGLLMGAALVSKYTVAQICLLPAVVLFVLPMGWVILRGGRARAEQAGQGKRGVRALVFALALGALPLVFWLGKNVAFYGNPLEPFFERVFRPSDAAAALREQFYIESHYPQSFFSAGYWISLPLRIGGLQWLWLAPIAGFPLVAHRRGAARLLAFCVLSLLLWNLVRESQTRFLLPALVLLIMLSARIFNEMKPGSLRAVFAALLVIMSCSSLALHALRLGGGGVFSYAARFSFDAASRTDWRRDELRARFYRDNLGALGEILFVLNTQAPADGKTLLVYEARPWLFAAPVVYNTVFDDSALVKLARGAANGGEVASRLRQAGITRVLVNRQELRRFIEQYARPWQLERLGIRDPVAEFDRIAAPEDLYPPFYLSPEWPALRQPIMEFLALSRARATSVAGRPPVETYAAPVP
ncbi:MAG: hypothetical protein WCK47_12410 [bacterium]